MVRHRNRQQTNCYETASTTFAFRPTGSDWRDHQIGLSAKFRDLEQTVAGGRQGTHDRGRRGNLCYESTERGRDVVPQRRIGNSASPESVRNEHRSTLPNQAKGILDVFNNRQRIAVDEDKIVRVFAHSRHNLACETRNEPQAVGDDARFDEKPARVLLIVELGVNGG